MNLITQKTKIHKYGLITYGIILISRIVTVFIPDRMIVIIGNPFNLPSLNVRPASGYVTRVLSLASFIIGLLILYLVLYPFQQARLIVQIGCCSFALLPVFFFIHFTAGTPLIWAVEDLIGLILVWYLCRQIKQLQQQQELSSSDI